MKKTLHLLIAFLVLGTTAASAQQVKDSLLTIDRIYNSYEFNGDYQPPVSWIEDGDAYISIEHGENGQNQLMKYISKSNEKSVYISAVQLTPAGQDKAINIEDFSLSPDGKKVLIFTNSSRVWRSNTKGDYWVYDFDTQKITQIGKDFASSSLMFAKFSQDNKFVAYVQDFNIYKENFNTGEVVQLTKDGNGDIINGTFDWVYEEEFGDRDGFRWSPDANQIAFWQLNASEIGTFYMVDNTDSVYSQPVPLQYPKVGYNPSSAKVGVIDLQSQKMTWIPIPGDPVQHYLPAMQWVDKDLLLIQQLNRKQNALDVYTYQPSTEKLKKVYTESEDTWVDINYPDISSNSWGQNSLLLTDNNTSFLRMSEKGDWRHVIKISLKDGKKTELTPGDYDVASVYAISKKDLYFSASPDNPTQRYLYSVPLNGKGKLTKITPDDFAGINTYDIAPNAKYAIHEFSNVNTPRTSRLVNLPKHKTIATLVDNQGLKDKLTGLEEPKTDFFKVTTAEGIPIDGRITYPPHFDETKKYPVLFNVYGEPAGQVAVDSWIGLYDIFLAQKGFVIIKMDNRGTPSLKGSKWRKSIYRKIGVLNTRDQALAAEQVLKKFSFLDKDRVNVWGWSGGGSMTQNLMFRYPKIYKTGIAVAGVANQLFYDNVYQERYMGLPQENMKDFVEGSPATYANGLEGNLLLIHGTGDDNVHYQNMEFLVNALIRNNKQFQMMAYPNRTHGIYEGENTRRHLYTLMSNYLLEHNNMQPKK